VSELPVRVPDCFAPEFGQKNARNLEPRVRYALFPSVEGESYRPGVCRSRPKWTAGDTPGIMAAKMARPAPALPVPACLRTYVRTYTGRGWVRVSTDPADILLSRSHPPSYGNTDRMLTKLKEPCMAWAVSPVWFLGVPSHLQFALKFSSSLISHCTSVHVHVRDTHACRRTWPNVHEK